MPDTTKEYRIKCADCGEVIVCDESILDIKSPCCSICQYPIVVENYQSLYRLKQKRQAEAEAKKQREKAERERRQQEKQELMEQKAHELALERIKIKAQQKLEENEKRERQAQKEQERKRLYEERMARGVSQEEKTAQVVGFVGCFVLFVGVFLPLIKAPVLGEINYFRNGEGDGVFVLVLAGVSFFCILARKYWVLWLSGLGSAGIIAFTFYNIKNNLAKAKAGVQAELADNPFRGLADVAFESVQFEFGWAVLMVGVILLLASAYLGCKELYKDFY